MFLNFVFITPVVGESSSGRSWWDVSRVVWMLEHWSHMISWQFIQTDDAATLHCLDIWHTLQFAISLVSEVDRVAINLSMKKLALSFETPPTGTTNSFRHIGQGMASPSSLSLQYCSRHFRQIVWKHGKIFGWQNTSVQMGHSVMSLTSFTNDFTVAILFYKWNIKPVH